MLREPLCLRLQLKVKVLWVKVMNPYVSVLSAAAVTVKQRHKKKMKLFPRVRSEAFFPFLPFAVRVEGNAVDGTEMPFDPSELLLVGSVEEPERDETCFPISSNIKSSTSLT